MPRRCVSAFEGTVQNSSRPLLRQQKDSAVGYVLAGVLKGGVLLAVRATLNLSLAALFFFFFPRFLGGKMACANCDLHAARFFFLSATLLFFLGLVRGVAWCVVAVGA